MITRPLGLLQPSLGRGDDVDHAPPGQGRLLMRLPRRRRAIGRRRALGRQPRVRAVLGQPAQSWWAHRGGPRGNAAAPLGALRPLLRGRRHRDDDGGLSGIAARRGCSCPTRGAAGVYRCSALGSAASGAASWYDLWYFDLLGVILRSVQMLFCWGGRRERFAGVITQC